MARYFNPLPKGSLTADDTAPEQGYRYFPTPPEQGKVPNALALEAPPVLKRDTRGAREGGLLAALGALLGGRADLAGGFGAAYMGGARQGEDNRFARDTQQWQQQRSNDLALNQNKMQLFGVEEQQQQRRFANQSVEASNRFRWGQADEAKQQRVLGNQRADANQALSNQRYDANQATGQLKYLLGLPKDTRAGVAAAIGYKGNIPDFPDPQDASYGRALHDMFGLTGRVLGNPYIDTVFKSQFGATYLPRLMGSVMSGMGGRSNSPLGSAGFDPSTPPTPAAPASGVPYLNGAQPVPAPPTATPSVKPMFYSSGMTPAQEGMIKSRNNNLGQRKDELKFRVGQAPLNRNAAMARVQATVVGASARLASQQAFSQKMAEIKSSMGKDMTPYQIFQAREKIAKMKSSVETEPAFIFGKDANGNDSPATISAKKAIREEIGRLEKSLPGYTPPSRKITGTVPPVRLTANPSKRTPATPLPRTAPTLPKANPKPAVKASPRPTFKAGAIKDPKNASTGDILKRLADKYKGR